MQNISIWISAIRLRTLPLSISGIILAACLAHYNSVFEWRIFILALLTTLSFQILSNLSNDYGDGVKGTDNEDRIGPERAIQSGEISPEELMNAIKLNIIISIILFSNSSFASRGGLNKDGCHTDKETKKYHCHNKKDKKDKKSKKKHR